jgi:hypothetical protein
MADKSFFLDSRLKAQGDIQRSYLFELLFPDISKVCTSIKDPEALLVRTRTATIPSRGNETIESFFFGQKQLFPGRPVFGNTMNITVEEASDQRILKCFHEWNSKICDMNPDSANAGVAAVAVKRGGYSIDAFLRTYSYDGTELGKKIQFVNCWIGQIDDTQLDYSTSDSIKYNISLNFDYWKLV